MGTAVDGRWRGQALGTTLSGALTRLCGVSCLPALGSVEDPRTEAQLQGSG